ncbi:UvrD-helicase domain-containing protein [Streptomyces sp. NPDC093591]|uniref:UvrD-helicase domain-containing protein n=1 Tax=Streptomyces sp. NPDC093591 TaxID=3366044 RepID=UPI0037F19055
MPELYDAQARQRIREQLDRTLFVEAGAGSGKTRLLVERVAAIVLNPESAVPLRHVAAVTFTDKAAAELRDRLRVTFEEELATTPPHSERAIRAERAIEDLDSAAIGTLHSFARRILDEHSIEAGLPPVIEVLDEVASGVAFDNWWMALRTELLDDGDISPALLFTMAAGMQLEDLRSMARDFTTNWDLLEPCVLASPVEALPPVNATALVTEARRLAALRDHCKKDTDKFLPHLDELATWADRLANARDDPARLAALGEASKLKWGHGQGTNWTEYGLNRLKSECRDLAKLADELRSRVLDLSLRRLAVRIAQATLQAAQARREEGRLQFHDLLVLARDLLRSHEHGAAVRAALQHRYRRLLLDELQDTDPIQIELAVRIAGGAEAAATDWADIDVPDGSLFAVGDPKQSIYRFRRADINTYLDAQQRIGDHIILETNFRTSTTVLDWINHVFSRLITPQNGSQPEYHPLHAHRRAAPAGPPVLILGMHPHEGKLSADELRTREAADVVSAVRTVIAERWQVLDEHQQHDGETKEPWRDVKLHDIAVFIPARTSLPDLEDALDAAGIPYHAEASSLVYSTPEVRDLLMAARAADDPSDALALVTALGSPLFGCGDDDLWTWHRAGGRWNILAPPPDTIPATHPVREAVAYLQRLHNDRTWRTPSEILGRLVEERRMLELAADTPRARDIWRRLRFVIDHARAWSEAEHGALRNYLAWAERQGSETVRVTEALLPETDTDAIRIMTVHAAKGLEFPVVILSGMCSQRGGKRSGVEVLWPHGGGCELKLREALQTSEFDAAKPVDEQMDHHEQLRLLYVACTRARDHLIVSLHRKAPASKPSRGDRKLTHAELLADACADAPEQTLLTAPPDTAGVDLVSLPRRVALPPPFDQWHEAISSVRERAARPAVVSASQFEGSLGTSVPHPATTDRLGVSAAPGLVKEARDLELPPWCKGRYGTAIGRAVHAVLQTMNLRTGEGLDDAVAEQVLAEGVEEHADIVSQLARTALQSNVVQRAASRPHWRETYVGTAIGDRVLEGIVDLMYRDDDGLVVVDYKTDTVPPHALGRRVAFYRPQMAAYAAAIQAATGEHVARCVLVFLSIDGAVERQVEDLDEAVRQIRTMVEAGCEVPP